MLPSDLFQPWRRTQVGDDLWWTRIWRRFVRCAIIAYLIRVPLSTLIILSCLPFIAIWALPDE